MLSPSPPWNQPMRLPIASLALSLLAACSNTPPPAPLPASEPQRPIGGDRDEHGCLPAAGYQWCAKTDRCERPWELAKEKGFANTTEAYGAYCNGAEATEVSPPAS
jgi:hypothetical protein